jgi:ribonuclease Z
MSVIAGTEWSYQKHKFFGLSLSGIRTAISMPDLSLSFDVAQGYPFLLNLKHYFISHGHLDHAAGIPYIISQKAMTNQEPGRFYMPSSLIEPMTQIMNTWEEIEKHSYRYHFVPVQSDSEFIINAQYFIKSFPTTHRIESFGYTLFERQKKLKNEFLNLGRDEILKLKSQKVEIQEFQEIPIVTFTGDTQIEFLKSRRWIKNSKIIFLEATYLDDKRSIEHARTWGHTHLDEIIPLLPEINCEQIVLIHASARYSDNEALKIIDQKIPPQFKKRVLFFPGR